MNEHLLTKSTVLDASYELLTLESSNVGNVTTEQRKYDKKNQNTLQNSEISFRKSKQRIKKIFISNKENVLYQKCSYMAVNAGLFPHKWRKDLQQQRCGFTKGF